METNSSFLWNKTKKSNILLLYTYFLQFVNKYLSPSSCIPVDMAKFITSISLFPDKAIRTSSFTGTFSRLNFLRRLHLLNNIVRLSGEIYAILRSRYSNRDLKSGCAAFISTNIGGLHI